MLLVVVILSLQFYRLLPRNKITLIFLIFFFFQNDNFPLV